MTSSSLAGPIQISKFPEPWYIYIYNQLLYLYNRLLYLLFLLINLLIAYKRKCLTKSINGMYNCTTSGTFVIVLTKKLGRSDKKHKCETSETVKRVREKSRECHNHKPQPFPNPKRKRKPTNLNKHKPNKCTKSTKISSLFPKRGNHNTKRTGKHKNKMTHGKTYNKSPRRINHKATNRRLTPGPPP